MLNTTENYQTVKTFSVTGQTGPVSEDGSTLWRRADVYMYYHPANKEPTRYQTLFDCSQYTMPGNVATETDKQTERVFYGSASEAEHNWTMLCIKAMTFHMKAQANLKFIAA